MSRSLTHQHYQNRLAMQQEQKSIANSTKDSKLKDNIQNQLIKKNILMVLFFVGYC